MRNTMDKTKKGIPQWITALPAVLFVAYFKILMLFFSNPGEMTFSDILPLIGQFSIAGILIFAVYYYFFLRTPSKAGMAAAITLLISEHYALIERGIQHFIPSLRYHQIILLMLLGLYFMALLIDKMPDDLCEIIANGIGLLMIVIPLLSFFRNINGFIRKPEEHNTAQIITDHSDIDRDEKLPNFYYLLTDEYAGFEEIRDYFGYDNKPFEDWLTERKFTVSPDSHNEGIRTDVVATNIVNLAYIVDPTTPDRGRLLSDNALFPLMKEYGYEIIAGPGSDFYGLLSDDGRHGGGAATIEGYNATQIILSETFLYPFVEPDYDNIAEKQQEQFDILKHPEEFPEENAFIVSHLDAPHIPYIFRADGTVNPRSAFYESEDRSNYVQYYQYVTSQLEEIIDAIISADPDAVIFLFSDHGNRFPATLPFEAQSNVLNAVYYRGEPMPEILGQSSLNTLRLILNRLLGTDYDLLEVPRYEQE